MYDRRVRRRQAASASLKVTNHMIDSVTLTATDMQRLPYYGNRSFYHSCTSANIPVILNVQSTISSANDTISNSTGSLLRYSSVVQGRSLNTSIAH